MLTRDGQIARLKAWREYVGTCYIHLLNLQEEPTKDINFSYAQEAADPEGRSGYERVPIFSREWSLPQTTNGSNASITSAAKSIGPFNEEIAVTHVALCNENGTIYLIAPLADYMETGQPRVFMPGEVFEISIKDEQA